MLLVKIVEAVVRIIGGVGFDRSRHVVDSGLLGACGLLGCCGPRKRRSKRRPRKGNNSYKATELQAPPDHRDSDSSSYIPPVFPNSGGTSTPTRFQGNDSRKGSTHSGPPPSVLRPEHAMRPYREDSDDEGFIMGAWQPFPKPGYAPIVSDSPLATTPKSSSPPLHKPSQSTSTVAPSGFSRVGGGRAHIDTPYAINAGSTHTFPSVGQQSVPYPVFDNDDSPPPSLSNVGVGTHHLDVATLPPGAMQPSHIRTKSQTAIIEDASILASLKGLGPPGRAQMQPNTSSGGLLRPPIMSHLPTDFDDRDSEDVTPRKKPWYQLRRKPHSSEGSPAAGAPSGPLTLPVDEELGGLGAAPQPGRSFVVIRKPQPGGSSPRAANATA